MTHSRLDVSTTLVEDLVVANRVLASHGVLDAFGHVSARSDYHADRYVLAHFLAPEMVNEDDLIEYDLNSNPIAPAPPKQYLERYIHGEIYRARPDVMAVVHGHSPSVIPFAVSSIPLRSLVGSGRSL
jgi:ribulose-5-phosphate 4-epimerase/fuculose-1-phosphate aldolase